MKFNEDNTKTWAEGTEPTPEQWSNWFVMLPNDQKLKVAEHLIVQARDNMHCFMMDHVGRLEELARLIDLGKWLIAEADWNISAKAAALTGNGTDEYIQRTWHRIQRMRRRGL